MKAARGFTLIELLVALAVFAVVAVTVYTRSGDALTQLQRLEQRTVAGWLAQNELALARIQQRLADEPLSLGTTSKEMLMAGRDWRVTVRVESTSNPWLRRLEVAVAPAEERDAQGYQVVGFVGQY